MLNRLLKNILGSEDFERFIRPWIRIRVPDPLRIFAGSGSALTLIRIHIAGHKYCLVTQFLKVSN